MSTGQIAKNSLYLYIRLAIVMVVQFYTSRVILNILGVDDYGLFSVISSIVVALSFVSGPLTTATQRFLTYELGNGGKKLQSIFSISLLLFLFLSFVLFLFFEICGVWFLNEKMNIDAERLVAANWTFQFYIATFIVSLLRIPYESTLVSYERMSFYALLSIIETVLLLAIVYILLIPGNIDKLILYSCLMFVSKALITLCYKIYCNRNFACTKYKYIKDSAMIRKILKFSGWNLFGAMSSSASTQGINILLNIFFGVAVNASYGIASQVGAGVRSFVFNFQKAVNPPIIKSYASNDLEYMHLLLCKASKYSYFLLFVFVYPLISNMDFVLKLWLGDTVPEYAGVFCSLMLVQMLIVCFGDPIDTAVFSTGDIKNYQLTLSGILFLNLIFSYLLFIAGMDAFSCLIVKCVIEFFVLTARLWFVHRKVGLSLKEYTFETFLPVFKVTLSTIFFMFIFQIFMVLEIGWKRFVLSCVLFLIVYSVSLWYVGLDRREHRYVLNLLKTRI